MINRRFVIKKKLGQGRSSVFLCEDLEQSKQLFALKVLPRNSSEEELIIFKNEFETIQKLAHTNIIRAYERGTVVEAESEFNSLVGSKFIVMEYFPGKELIEHKIKDESELKLIITQICSVLFYLHQSKYIYYDLKLENILVGEKDGKLMIKLIDLGFAKRKKFDVQDEILGTAEYLAPELLKKEPHDHRVDLYSFGILLYRLIYGKFPFSSTHQLEIYKEHISKEFIFPESAFSEKLLLVVKKLLSKNPDQRYFSAVQILYDLDIPITEEIYREWIPANNFSDRDDILNIVNNYVTSPSEGEVIIIRGFERAGKSSVVNEIHSRYKNVILIPNDKTKTSTAFVKFFLNKLIFNEINYSKIDSNTFSLVDKLTNLQSDNLKNDLKLLVNKLSFNNRFILLLDDFNLYDSFAIEIFNEIFPVLQVNGCNIILTEKSDLDYVTDFVNNSVKLDLGTFTSVQVEDFLKTTYADFIPCSKIVELVMRYADFLPGNVMEFLRQIVLLKIIRFEYDEIKIHTDKNTEKILENIYEEIYKIRYNSLTEEEANLSLLLSSFEINPAEEILTYLIGYPKEKFAQIIKELQLKHILNSQSRAGLNFTSDGMKNFIYSQIADRKSFHKKLADQVKEKFPEFDNVELARHYEIIEDYDMCYSLLISEADKAEKLSAFKYARTILERLSKMPLTTEQNLNVMIKLTKLCDILNDFKQTLEFSSQLIKENLQDELNRSILYLYGNSLIRTGKIEEGIKILKSLLSSEEDEGTKIKLQLGIAGAELDLNNFESAYKICEEIINNKAASNEQKGDAFNLLGIIDFHLKGDLDSALQNFNECLVEYNMANNTQRVAAVEINIGNIYNIRRDFETVQKHWNKSLDISSATGNLYLQGKVLLNLGAFNFHQLNLDEAINNYQRAKLIFISLGDLTDCGLAQSNLGEVFLINDEFQNALDAFEEARMIFAEAKNHLEEAEVLFLMGKLFNKMGDYEKLETVISGLEKILAADSSVERLNYNLILLSSFKNFRLDQRVNVDKVLEAADKYLEQEDKLNYFDAVALSIKYYVKTEMFENAYELLTNDNFTQVSASNKYLSAERFYLLGLIANSYKDVELANPIDYFEKALEILNELNVTDLTWKILLEISCFYFERGNKDKSDETANYGRSIIKYLGESIQSAPQKDIFFAKPERKLAWEKFTEILNQQ